MLIQSMLVYHRTSATSRPRRTWSGVINVTFATYDRVIESRPNLFFQCLKMIFFREKLVSLILWCGN